MHCTAWKIVGLILIVALGLTGRLEAQQDQRPHQRDVQTPLEQSGQEPEVSPDQTPTGQPMQGMMQQMQGMMRQMHSQMGRGGMRGRGMMRGHGGVVGHMQRNLDRLTGQLELSDEQQSKAQALLRAHAKEGIRLKADIDTASIDLQQLLDTQPVDMDNVKTTLQTIAEKEAALRLTHIAAMQDIRKLLTPEQQQQFRMVWGHMLGGGGKMARGGMRGRHGMQKHGRHMRRGGMKGPGAMSNPCDRQRSKSNN